MNTTLEELIRAMENCPVLSLSEDKKRVGRKIALDLEPLPEGAEEERTVYLEPVPPHATHEDVAKFVEVCGFVPSHRSILIFSPSAINVPSARQHRPTSVGGILCPLSRILGLWTCRVYFDPAF